MAEDLLTTALKSAGYGTAPATPAASPQNDDPLTAALKTSGYGGVASAPTVPVQQTPVHPAVGNDPLTAALVQSGYGGRAAQSTSLSSQPDTGAANQGPTLAEDAYGNDQPWWNRPITSYAHIPTYGWFRDNPNDAGPIEKGVEKFASGMLTPLNIGLMVATGGLGSLAEGAGLAAAEGVLGPEVIAGLRATGWTGEAAEGAVKTLVSQGWKQDAAITALKGLSEPGMAASTAQNLVKSLAPASAQTVMKGARVAAQMANAKFTYDQIAGLAHSVPAVADAIREGDSDKAIELGTEALLGGAMAAMSGYHLTHSAIKEGVFGLHPFDVDEKGNYVVSPKNSLLQEQDLGKFLAEHESSKFLKENDKAFPDKGARAGAIFSAEANNSPEKLEQQMAGIQANDAIPEKEKAELLSLWQEALDVARAKPGYAALGDKVRQEKAEYWRKKIEAGRVKEADPNNPNTGANNYVVEHVYRPDENPANSDFETHGRKAAHLNERKFDTYYDAAMAVDKDGNWLGLMPHNPDIIYSHAKYIIDHYKDLGHFKSVQKGFAAQVPEGGKLITRARELETVANAPEEKVYLKPDQAVQSTGQPEGPEEAAKKGLVPRREPLAGASSGNPEGDLAGKSEVAPEHREYAEAVDKAEAEYAARGAAAVKAYQEAGKTPEALKTLRAEKQAALEAKTEAVAEADAKLLAAKPEMAAKPNVKTPTERLAENGNDRTETSDDRPVDQTPEDEEGGAAKPKGKAVVLKQEDGTFKDQYGRKYLSAKDYVKAPDVFKTPAVEMKTVAGSIEEEARKIAEKKDLDYDKLDPTNRAKILREAKKFADKVPISELQDSLVHPNHAKDITQLFEDRSAVQEHPLGKLALGFSSAAKKSLLGLSPFHWVTIIGRHFQAGGTLAEVMNPPEIDANSPRTEMAVRSTLTLGGGEESRAMREGIGEKTPALLEKTPGIGPAVKWLNDSTDKLFNVMIPRWKMLAWERAMTELAEKNPNMTESHRAFTASTYVNGLFGGVNWKSLGISATNQDLLRLGFLAPDFTGSHLLVGKAALEGGGSVVSQGFARIAIYNAVAALALNAIIQKSKGRSTEDALKIAASHPFGVVSPDDKKVYSIRTMPSDTFRALTDPRQFVFNRLNPLTIRTGMEYIQGRNDRGQAVDTQQQVIDLLRNVTPMSIQNIIGVAAPRFVGGQRPSAGEVFGRMGGLSISNNATEAEKLAGKLASSHGQEGPVDPDRLAKHKQIIDLEEGLAKGEKTSQDLYSAVERGELAPTDAKSIMTALKTAKDVPPQFMQLYLRSNKLPLPQLIQVYDSATPTEQRILVPLLQRKVPQYYKTIRTKLSPQEVAKDPTYLLLRQRWPQVPNF